MSFNIIPQDPVELAEVRAEQLTSHNFEMSERDMREIAELEHAAELLGFQGEQFFVDAHIGYELPVSFDKRSPVRHRVYDDGLSFEGELVTYSRVHVGSIIGVGAVRAISLAFNNVTLLPYFSEIKADSLLYVPVLAVSRIEGSE